MEIDKCTESEAKKELARIKGDGQITGQDIDWTQTDENDNQDAEEDQEGEDVEDEPSGESAAGGNS